MDVTAGRLLYVGHATVLIELDGVRLLTDPVLRPRVWHLRRRVPLDKSELEGIDAALVSHVHFDHFDRPSLRRLGTDVTVVVPVRARSLVRGFADVREVDVGDEVHIGSVEIRATPAVHQSARLMLRSAPSLGFLISGSRRIYFAGDTDPFDGMSARAGSLDVALLPVAGWGSKVGPGHLDPLRAAQALRLLNPRLAVPIHWGTFSTLNRSTSVDPPEAFRRHAAELAPEVEVRILDPGTALTF
jgi:L-ascorbate metabolism protein UlaG (beta-lactamase superfamily)